MTDRPSITLAELEARVGERLGSSDWILVDQDRIDKFADLTEDWNFIHVDPERTRAETQFDSTIAHGFLTMSLLSVMGQTAVPPLEGRITGLNYGFDKLRFVRPVPSGRRVRGHFDLGSIRTRPDKMIEVIYDVSVEIEGEEKPAIVARWVSLHIMQQDPSKEA